MSLNAANVQIQSGEYFGPTFMHFCQIFRKSQTIAVNTFHFCFLSPLCCPHPSAQPSAVFPRLPDIIKPDTRYNEKPEQKTNFGKFSNSQITCFGELFYPYGVRVKVMVRHL